MFTQNVDSASVVIFLGKENQKSMIRSMRERKINMNKPVVEKTNLSLLLIPFKCVKYTKILILKFLIILMHHTNLVFPNSFPTSSSTS